MEPEPSVTITDETFFGHGWQPMTMAVLQANCFLPAGEEFGVDELVGWFHALGWKSANGRPLGEDAMRRELALIRKAGYIRAYRLHGDGGQIGARCEALRFVVRGQQTEERRGTGVCCPRTTHLRRNW
ncbi:hypothetical protein [Streptomyces sp. NPDC002403]